MVEMSMVLVEVAVAFVLIVGFAKLLEQGKRDKPALQSVRVPVKVGRRIRR
jgi:hypothetical protein